MKDRAHTFARHFSQFWRLVFVYAQLALLRAPRASQASVYVRTRCACVTRGVRLCGAAQRTVTIATAFLFQARKLEFCHLSSVCFPQRFGSGRRRRPQRPAIVAVSRAHIHFGGGPARAHGNTIHSIHNKHKSAFQFCSSQKTELNFGICSNSLLYTYIYFNIQTNHCNKDKIKFTTIEIT